MKRVKLYAVLILIVLAIVVILQNTETVETSLLFLTLSMPRALLLGVTLLIGFGAGIVFTARRTVSRKKKTE